jgi:fucose 4-O-acetylase-like acetyltransferase
METKETLRNQTIDAIKGFTIILVVLAHAIQRNIIDSESNIINCLINSFHMHLFMFLSGYLIAQSISKPRYKWLFKRFVRLILPFFVWSIIMYYMRSFDFSGLIYFGDAFKDGIIHSLINCFLFPWISLWFLYVLFMFYALLLILQIIEKKIGMIIYVIVFLLLQFIPFSPFAAFGLYQARWLCMFFFGGYLISIHKDKIPNINLIYKLVIIFSFPLLFIIYRYFKLAPMWFYPWPISPTNAMFLTFRYLLAWSGVAATWLTISSICNTNILRPLSYIGLFTLDIYAIHLMVLRLGIGEEWLMVLTVTVFALAISLIVSWLIRRSKILTLIFFGQYDWNSNKLM